MSQDSPILALHQDFAAGRQTVSRVVEDALARIEKWQSRTNLFVRWDPERARRRAREADERYQGQTPRGYLEGIMVGAKDLIDVQGLPTTAGSRILCDAPAAEKDATVIRYLKGAGAIVDMGKLNLHEFAYGPTSTSSAFGPVRNPYDPTRMAGGSSGGSGVAVATGLMPAALGTDTGGSIRIPAAFNGVTGFKPSYGRVSCDGVIPLSWSLDHVGPLTRTVADAALLMDVLTADKAPGPFFRQLETRRPWRLFWPNDPETDAYHGQVADAVENAVAVLQRAGAEIIRGGLPEMAAIRAAQNVLIGSEAAAFHWPWLAERPQDYQADVRERLFTRSGYLAVQYISALRQQRRLIELYARWFGPIDAIILPTVPILPPKLEETETVRPDGRPEDVRATVTRLTSPFNLLGLPALALPAGRSQEGLPLSVQIVGGPGQDATVLAIGHHFQSLTDFHRMTPPEPSQE